jgi:hypothetical protein
MIKFRQQVEVRCSKEKCTATQMATGYFFVGPDNIVKLSHFVPVKGSGWRSGRFIPGVLSNKTADIVLYCEEHVDETDKEGEWGTD